MFLTQNGPRFVGNANQQNYQYMQPSRIVNTNMLSTVGNGQRMFRGNDIRQQMPVSNGQPQYITQQMPNNNVSSLVFVKKKFIYLKLLKNNPRR